VSRPDRYDVAITAGAAVLAMITARLDHETLITGVFITFVYTLIALLARAGVEAWSRGAQARARARLLARTRPDQVAREAIEEERRRLSIEISGMLRETLEEVAGEVSDVGRDDPRPALRRVHAATQLATSELRRQLGLLREQGDAVPDEEAATPGAPSRRDLYVALAITAVAAVETSLYLFTEGKEQLWPGSAITSTLAAATVVGRRSALALATTCCAAVFAISSVVGSPVFGGFWSFGTVGMLLWTVAVRDRWRLTEVAAGAALVASVVWTRRVDDPDNLEVIVVIMVVAVVAGLVARALGAREASFRSRAERRAEELRVAAEMAVNAERLGFARELHDVTSHAVGLIALQAAAAQVSWPTDPDSTRASIAVIRETAETALRELDGLGIGATPPRSIEDIHALVERIRAAHTRVDLRVEGELAGPCAGIVHRVVQEALTNTVRHAPGAAATVDVRVDDARVHVRVRDDGGGTSARRPGTTRGFGLVGLAERVQLAGGTLTAGPDESGGFVVEAVVPVVVPAVPA
jgi:signal transduction histidine kinase